MANHSRKQKMSSKIELGFQKQSFMNTLGARLGKFEFGKCEIIVPFQKKLTQQHGFFHGGLVATIADNAAGFAAYSVMADYKQPLTIEFKISLLAPSDGERLVARAEVIKAGRSIFHAHSNVFVVKNNQESLTATALVTIKSTSSVSEI